ncbi:MAG: hypothetical protein P8J50_15575 [Acidimicrobiales bacterium]|jgi:hypothetical protein|nr:hypothetical protein [Acidimicrobiales bacterium]
MENSDIKPSTIMLIVGGAVLAISTFLDWSEIGFANIDFDSVFSSSPDLGVTGWENNAWGLFGIFVFIIGVAVAGGVAAQQFGNVSMPDKILSFDHNQLHFMLGMIAFVPLFGFFLGGPSEIGVLIGFIAAAVIVAASVMDMQASDGGDAAPPTEF